MAKYDGWIVKDLRYNTLLFSYLSYHRSSCVDIFNVNYGRGAWRKQRGKTHKIVKVKLIEVE